MCEHYVVAGRIERDGQLGGHFAWVTRDAISAREFMKAALADRGWTEQSRVTVLADGADGLKSVVQGAVPQVPRNILDWVPYQHASPTHRADGHEHSGRFGRR